MNVLNTRISQTNKNTIYLYQKTLENELVNIVKFMVDLTANDSDYSQLINKADPIDAYVASDNVMKKYDTIINVYPMIGGMFIYSKTNQIFRMVYNEGYSYETKVALEEFLKKQTKDKKTCNTGGWFAQKIRDRYFLFRILGIKGTYTICTIELDNIKSVQIGRASV
jgi:two-component system sensor histidine kinase YesM